MNKDLLRPIELIEPLTMNNEFGTLEVSVECIIGYACNPTGKVTETES